MWRTLAAMLDVSYIYMSQRDLPGFAFEPELKSNHAGGDLYVCAMSIWGKNSLRP